MKETEAVIPGVFRVIFSENDLRVVENPVVGHTECTKGGVGGFLEFQAKKEGFLYGCS